LRFAHMQFTNIMRQGQLIPYWIFSLLLFTASSVFSQGYNFGYRHFSIEDGLPSRFVNEVVQDDQGFIWIGTSAGVNRFDGRRFKGLEGSKKEPHPYVNAHLFKDIDGKIWINYEQNYNTADILDPVTGVVTPIEKMAPELAGKRVVLLKTGKEKDIWGIIDRNVFFRYDGKFHFSKPVALSRQKDRGYRTYLPTPWGNLLVANDKGLSEYNMEGQVVGQYPNIWLHALAKFTDSSLLIPAILPAVAKKYPIQLWEMHKNAPPQLVKLTKNGKPFTLGDVDDSVVFMAINKDQDGNTWIVLPNRLLIFDEHWELKADESHADSYWRRFESRNIFFDNQSQAWASAKDGIYAISTERSNFRKLMQNPEIGFSLRGMTELSGGSLLACSYAGIFKVDLQTGIHVKIANDFRYGVKKASDGRIWLGSHSSKTFQLNPTSLQFKQNGIDSNILTTDELMRPFEDPETGTIYFGSRRQGLTFFNDKTQLVEPYRQLNQFSELKSIEILDMLPNKDAIWVATSNGLYKMDRAKGFVARYDQFPVNYIYQIAEDKDGILWLSTGGGGLLRWNSVNNTVKQYSTANGLSNNTIYAAYDDGMGYLWLPSNYGLMRFEKSTGIVFNYLPRDGITHEEFNNSSHYRGADGSFYFGGLNGITAFKPSEISAKSFDAPLVVTDCEVLHGNQLESRMDGFSTQNGIEIQSDEKSFTLEFALLDYRASKQLYAWRLDGLDKDWTYQSESNIRFNALPYGKFTLRIKGQGAGSNWSSNELAIPIHIIKPFYLTWKFALLCIFGLALLTFLFIRWRTKWLQREKDRLTALVDERSRELVRKNVELESLNHTKDRLFTIIGHDLRSPLVTLGGLAQKVAFLLRKGRMEEIQQLGDTIENAVANVRNLLDNLLKWSIVQDGRFPNNPECLNASEIVEEVVALYGVIAEAKGVRLSFQNINDPLVYADRNSVSTILRNLVDNAVKFTHEGEQVEVKVESRGQRTFLEVSDTGVGISAEALPTIFHLKGKRSGQGTKGEKGNGIGLALCRELVEISQGTIAVQNRPGGGTVFVVSLPTANLFQQIETL
jgi:signal transduction histidine kinase/ligand-binding sensor domain-containing protein